MITDKPKNKGGRPVNPTNRQKLAARLITEKHSKKAALLEAGYSEHQAAQPSRVIESAGFKIASKEIIKQLEEQRQLALARMAETIKQADYSSSTRGVDTMTKNIELLSGRPTDRSEDNTLKNLSTDELLSKLEAIRNRRRTDDEGSCN